jgi:hypothetical protein
MQALTERVKQLEDAFNTNTKAFSDGIQMIEAQQEVLRRVAQDLFNELRFGIKGHIPVTETNAINFNAYLKEYIEELAAAEAKAEAEKTHVKEHVIAAANEGEPIIFGGD